MIRVKKQVSRACSPGQPRKLGQARVVWGRILPPGTRWGGAPPCTRAVSSPGQTRVCQCPRLSRQIWVGGTGLSQGKSKGKIYVIDAERRTVEKELVAHSDTVKTLCSAEDRYVLSGSGREEGKIAIWKVE